MGKKLTKTYIIFAFHATLARELRTLENFWHDEFINENSELINGEQHIDDQSKNNLKEDLQLHQIPATYMKPVS